MKFVREHPLAARLAIAGTGMALLAATGLCALYVQYFDFSLIGLSQSAVRPMATPAVWASLPTPNLTHAGWSSFTFANTFRSVAFRDRFLFTATDGGVVAFDLANPNTAPVKFTTEHGLASNRVLSATASPDGTLWFGTESGLSHFDGANWRTYTVGDGLPSDEVRDLAFAADGALWIATSNGLARFDGDRWRSYRRFGTGLRTLDLRAVAANTRGLWIATAEGVTFFDGKRWTTFTYQDGLANDDTRDVALAPDGSVWIATRAGLSRFDGTAWSRFTTADGLLESEVQSVTVSPDGSVWVGYGTAAGGLSRFDGLSWQTVTTTDGLADDTVLSLAVAPTGEVWAGTADGLSVFDGRSWRSLNGPSEIPSNDMRGLIAARGAVWAATNQGVSRYDGNLWRLFTVADGLPANDVQALAVGPDDTPWAAFEYPADGLGYLAADDTWALLPCTPIGPASLTVNSVATEPDGTAWFATDHGVSHFEPDGGWATFTTRDGLPANLIEAVAVGPDGSVWAATPSGLVAFKDDAWSIITRDDVRLLLFDPQGVLWAVTPVGLTRLQDGQLGPVVGAPADPIRALAARDDGLWLATSAGIAHLRDAEWEHYTTANGLASDDVTALTAGADGRLWAGYGEADLGFDYFEEGRWRPSFLSPVLNDDNVTGILTAPDDTVWVATQTGLSRRQADAWTTFTSANGLPFERVTGLAYAYDSVWAAGAGGGLARYDASGTWQVYGATDGLATDPVVELAVAPDGQLWAGYDDLSEGLNVFDGQRWASLVGPQGEPAAHLSALAFTRDGRLWAGGWYGETVAGEQPGFLGVYGGGDWAFERLPEVARAIRVSADERLWIARSASVQLVDPELDGLGRTLAEYPAPGNNVLDMEIAPGGAVWITLYGDRGLYVLRNNEWQPEYFSDLQNWAGITDIAFEGDGTLWLGSGLGDGAARYAGVRQGWQLFQSPSARFGARVSGSVLSLAVEPDGALWLGTTGGSVSRFGPDLSHSNYLRALGPHLVRDIDQAADGTIWIATDGGGAYHFDGVQWTGYAPEPAVALNPVRGLALDKNGMAWLGTPEGPVHITTGECTADHRIGPINAASPVLDPAGGLWFATLGYGAMRWNDDGGSVWRVVERTGTVVSTLASAPDGSLWFAGDRGLTRYQGRDWQTIPIDGDLAAGGVTSLVVTPSGHVWLGTEGGAIFYDGRDWRPFTPADGLAASHVDFVVAAPGGVLWFATSGGISRYQP